MMVANLQVHNMYFFFICQLGKRKGRETPKEMQRGKSSLHEVGR